MKRIFLWLSLIPTISFAAAPIIQPSTPTVFVSSSMQFVADQTVSWSLATGSTGTIDSTTGLYTPPASFLAKNAWLGCPVLPNDHIYNTRIDSAPIQSSTNTYFHTNLDGVNVSFSADMPENIYTNSTAQTSLVFNDIPAANGNFPLLAFPDINVENGIFTDINQVDQHILGMNKQSCQASEVYGLTSLGGIGACPSCNSGSGVKYKDDYALNQGVDAAGQYVAPLAIRYNELRACVDKGIPIKHALRFTLSIGYLAPANIWPATAFATDGGKIPFGARFRLKAGVNISTYSATAQCVLKDLQQYGAFIVDGGLNMQFQQMQDATGDWDTFQALKNELPFGAIVANDFEAIDESAAEDLNPNSKTYQSGRASTTSWLTPDQYAIVIASNTSTHQTTQMPLILQPVTIGVDHSIGYNFMAGAPATQLNVWVNGSPTNSAFTCTMNPSTGTLTSGGLYTPPATVLTRTTSTVTCVTSADPAVNIAFPLSVYSSTGIREHLSETTNTDYGPDSKGNLWYADRFSSYRFQGISGCDFSYLPNSPWNQSTADIGLYYYCEHVKSGTGDEKYQFVVPNGTYNIKLYYGVGGTSAFAAGDWQEAIDSQGTIFSSSPSTTTLTGFGPWTELGLTGKYFDLCTLISGCANVTPANITLTSTVTDNNLYFAIRHLAPNGGTNPSSVLTAFEITSVASSAATHTTLKGGMKLKGGVKVK